MSRKIEDLTPKLQSLYKLFDREMKIAGIKFKVTQTLRTHDEQKALYAQGRHPINIVNTLRKTAGLAPISQIENKKKVTWTMNSKHLPKSDGKSIAFDICILDKLDKPDWNSTNLYKLAGEIGESIGLVWGGRWKNPDLPHFELKE